MVSITMAYESVGESKPLLMDLTSLLYDFELLYDFHVLSIVDGYEDYTFNRFFWYRQGRPIIDEEKLKLNSIHYGSQLLIATVMSAWIASKVIKPLVEISGEIADWPANRRKAIAEAAEAELEALGKAEDNRYKQLRNERALLLVEKTAYETEQERVRLAELKERRQRSVINQLKSRLARNTYRLTDLHVAKENRQDEGKKD